MSKPITAALVNDLRKRTDLPMMECKAAIDHLRKSGAKASLKRAGNETAEGRIGVYLDNAAQVGAIVELRCESAPVAKGEHFIKLANDVAKVVAAKNPASVDALLTTDSGS